MHRRIRVFGLTACLLFVGNEWRTSLLAQQTQIAARTIPSGLTIQLAVMRPVWSASAKPGDLLYAVTVAPVLVGGQTVVPAGSYVQGTLQGIVKPTARVGHATLAVRFDKLIYANGYTIDLSGASGSNAPETLSTLTIKSTTANDLLLDNGTPFVMTLQHDLPLDPQRAAQAIPLSHAPVPAQFIPATNCRFIPGYAGSPATPGTDIPGTPPTVIPGIDGTPPTIIPGTPATHIAGSPGTPASDPVYCPAPPQVLFSVPGFVLPAPAVSSQSNP